MVSVWGVMFVALAFVVLIFSQSGPVGAQETDGSQDAPAATDGNGGNGGGVGQGDDTPAERQYNVIIETIPKKPVLANTGGFPLLLGAGLLLVCAAAVSVRVLRP